MQQQPADPLSELGLKFINYLPTLAGGLFVVVLGLAAGWIVKRAVIRVLIWLRLDRLGGRLGWRAAFGKGDIRAALYNVVGSAAMVVVVLVFLDNALQIWGLTVLSRLLLDFLLNLPNLALVVLIAGAGLALSNAVANSVERALEEEDFPRARLVAKVCKAALLAVVSALALWQLNFAREIVLSAFLVLFGAVGVAFAVAFGLGSAKAIERGWETLLRNKEDNHRNSG
jgi:hypothetical protein